MSSVVIDLTLQCEKMIKEMSIIAHDGPSSFILKHYVFLPPTHLNKGFQSRFNREHIHGLPWNSGNTSYERIPEILREATENIKFIFTKGLDKCVLLKELLPNNRLVLDLMQFGCPKISTLLDSSHQGKPCLNHQEAARSHYYNSCSMVKVQALSTWLFDHQLDANLFDTAPRVSTFKGIKINVDPLTLAKHGFFRNSFEKDSVCCVFCEKTLKTCNYCIHDCIGWYGV